MTDTLLSDHYHRAVAEASRHHQRSKTYSGMFLRPHAPFIGELIRRLGVASILDYGCGKGLQYQWVSHGADTGIPAGQTLEEFWGVKVHKYDPCYEPFATPPAADQRFDLVLCTHVMGSVPIADLKVFRWSVYRWATKAVYIAEKLGPVGKQVFSDPERFPRDWTREEWVEALHQPNRPSLEIWLCTRHATPATVPVLVRERI